MLCAVSSKFKVGMCLAWRGSPSDSLRAVGMDLCLSDPCSFLYLCIFHLTSTSLANSKHYEQLMSEKLQAQVVASLHTIEDLETIASEHTLENTDTFVVVTSLTTGKVIYISEQATSMLGCKLKFLQSARFLELLFLHDVNVFYSYTSRLDLPTWCNTALFQSSKVKSFFCRIRDWDGDIRYSPFRMTPYLLKVSLPDEPEGHLCCLLLAEKILSGYEAPRIPTDKRIFTTTHSPSCMFQEVDERAVPLLGYLPQDLIGTSILSYLHPDDRPLMLSVHRKVLQFAGQPPFDHSPIRFRTQNGDFISLDTSWSSFVNPWSRKVAFIIGRHKVRAGPLNEDVFSSLGKEHVPRVDGDIWELQSQIHKLLMHGYGSLGSNGSHEHYVTSSSDSNGNPWDETSREQVLGVWGCFNCGTLCWHSLLFWKWTFASMRLYGDMNDVFLTLSEAAAALEDAAVSNEQLDMTSKPSYASPILTLPLEEFRKVGLTKEVLSAHTQKEEQDYVDRFRHHIMLSPYSSYLQRGDSSRAGSQHPGSTFGWWKGKANKLKQKCPKDQVSSDSIHPLPSGTHHCTSTTPAPHHSWLSSHSSHTSSSVMGFSPPLVQPTHAACSMQPQVIPIPVGPGMPSVNLTISASSVPPGGVPCNMPTYSVPCATPIMAVIYPYYTVYPQAVNAVAPLPTPPFYPTVPMSQPVLFSPSFQGTLPSCPIVQPQPTTKAVPQCHSPSYLSAPVSPVTCPVPSEVPPPLFSNSRSSSPLQLNLLQEELPKPVEQSPEETKCVSEFRVIPTYRCLCFICAGSSHTINTSKYFASKDSSVTSHKGQKCLESKEVKEFAVCSRSTVWKVSEEALMTYQIPTRYVQRESTQVLKEDLDKLLTLQSSQPWFSEAQKEELAEVHPWIRNHAVPQQINTQVEKTGFLGVVVCVCVCVVGSLPKSGHLYSLM
uniref:Period circadian clock 3 n=1 Tax=Erpetoichthys calabaricus TaxID=27687 RepID=A0A8C4RYP6_ERPCA